MDASGLQTVNYREDASDSRDALSRRPEVFSHGSYSRDESSTMEELQDEEDYITYRFIRPFPYAHLLPKAMKDHEDLPNKPTPKMDASELQTVNYREDASDSRDALSPPEVFSHGSYSRDESSMMKELQDEEDYITYRLIRPFPYAHLLPKATKDLPIKPTQSQQSECHLNHGGPVFLLNYCDQGQMTDTMASGHDSEPLLGPSASPSARVSLDVRSGCCSSQVRIPARSEKPAKKRKRLERTGCSCKRSCCLKNYCVCFKAMTECSSLCKCEGCLNRQGSPEKSPVSSRSPLTLITPGVVEATCACLLARAGELEEEGAVSPHAERMILERFGQCLTLILGSILNAANAQV